VPFRLALLVVSFALISFAEVGLLVFELLVLSAVFVSRIISPSIRGVDSSFLPSDVLIVINDCSLGDLRRSMEVTE